MIFIDTLGIYAFLDGDDPGHASAKECWFRLLDSGAPLLTTNYVINESCAPAQHRLGIGVVRAIQEETLPLLQIGVHALAIAVLLAARRRKLSLVDCCSFSVMRRESVRLSSRSTAASPGKASSFRIGRPTPTCRWDAVTWTWRRCAQ